MATLTSANEEALLQAAVAQHTPKSKTPTKRSVDWQTLTYDVLKATLTLQEPKPLSTGGFMAFFRFNLNKYCEIVGLPKESIDLAPFNYALTIKSPFARIPFGVSEFPDEKSGQPKYTLMLTLYNPQCQDELDAFGQWFQQVYRPVVLDLFLDQIDQWDIKNLSGTLEQKRAFVEMMLNNPVSKSKKEGYKDNISLKLKTYKDKDQPILTAWNDKTKGKVEWNLVPQGYMASAFINFEGLTMVQKSLYPRLFTRELIYTNGPPRLNADGQGEQEFPID